VKGFVKPRTTTFVVFFRSWIDLCLGLCGAAYPIVTFCFRYREGIRGVPNVFFTFCFVKDSVEPLIPLPVFVFVEVSVESPLSLSVFIIVRDFVELL